MIGPDENTGGMDGDAGWTAEEDARLLAALPPDLLSWIELQLSLRADPFDPVPHAERVRRYLHALVINAATICPALAEQAAAAALDLPHTPDPTPAAISPNDWTKVIQAGAACHGHN